jgi:hypothetical protein
MSRISDAELERELQLHKQTISLYESGHAPQSIIERQKFYLGILEELKKWRENGIRWLELLNRNPIFPIEAPYTSDYTIFPSVQAAPTPLAPEYEGHIPSDSFKLVSGKIWEVKCSCGEITKYKVPLNSIEEFECPKRKRA